jgi:hypothetical protein
MPSLIQTFQQVSPYSPASEEPIPPIPPRPQTRPRCDHRANIGLLATPDRSNGHPHCDRSFIQLEDLPSPDREWQLLENIGDGTYGEVFHVSIRNRRRIRGLSHVDHSGKEHSQTRLPRCR